MGQRRSRPAVAPPPAGDEAGRRSPGADRAPGPPAGHRLEPDVEGWWVEAWGPDPTRCLLEALAAIVEAAEGEGHFEEAPSYETVPLSAGPGGLCELLVALAEEIIGLQQVLSLVPVRVHLSPTEDGGVAGDLEVVRASPRPGSRLPRAVSGVGLATGHDERGSWCRLRLQG